MLADSGANMGQWLKPYTARPPLMTNRDFPVSRLKGQLRTLIHGTDR
jgi:hypothetical protein